MAGVRRALLVAVGAYDDPKLHDLRSPAIDVERLALVLGDPAIGDFQVESLRDPRDASMRRAIGRFFHDSDREDVLLMHISRHGITDENGDLYFAASDTELDAPYAALPAAWLNEQMSRSPSRQTLLMLDCCFSGKFPFGAKPRSSAAAGISEHLGGKGRAVITASNAMEYAYEGDRRSGEGKPSVFTGTVIQGLESGEADRDQDRWISADELYDYVYDHVREQTPHQRPHKYSSLEGPLYVARNPFIQASSAAEIDAEILGACEHPLPHVRAAAVSSLASLLASRNLPLARAARQQLAAMVDDDSRTVGAAVRTALDSEQSDQLVLERNDRGQDNNAPAGDRTRRRGTFDLAEVAGFPNERFRLDARDPSLKAIEWLTPFGKGSRVTIVGGAGAGKSWMIRALATALIDHDDLELEVALVGVRPEEIAEWRGEQIIPAETMGFSTSAEDQASAIERVLHRGRHDAMAGADVVILIDTLDGMFVQDARHTLAAACRLVTGGSVTIIATAARPIGGETTVIALDAALAMSCRFPAMDLVASSTVRPELLVGVPGAQAIAKARGEAHG